MAVSPNPAMRLFFFLPSFLAGSDASLSGAGFSSFNELFKVSFEEILCLDEKLDIDPDNIFKGHDRLFVVNAICRGELEVDIPSVFYQFSPNERLIILRNIKDGNIETNIDELLVKLTQSELKFISKNSLVNK